MTLTSEIKWDLKRSSYKHHKANETMNKTKPPINPVHAVAFHTNGAENEHSEKHDSWEEEMPITK